MRRLSRSIREIQQHYTVLVVGSGYGGAIAASRLARAGQQVCILEKGREFRSGEFPDTEAEALAEMQAELPGGHTGGRTGLYDFYINPDVNVFVGCGLGGTSLINGNVAVKPDGRVFEDAVWPAALRGDAAGMEAGFERAEEMLRPVAYPENYPTLPKLQALEKAAAHLGVTCTRPAITVSFTEGTNHVGMEQRACMLCGDCVTGCNYSAKNSMAFNYLPDAYNFGAEIYTQVAVRRLERQGERWVAHYQSLETGREEFTAATQSVSADIVVLAAGTLGSTEILLRSKAAGLSLSDQTGRHFSGNGDVLGYSFGCEDEIRGVGYGHRDARDMEAVGPCVTGMIDMRQGTELDHGIMIQEFVTPGALAGLLPEAIAKTGAALGKLAGEGLGEALAREGEVESLFAGPYESMSNHTQAYLVTTHEGGSGSMTLENDRLAIGWPHVGDQAIFEKVNETLAEATRALGGSYLINPVWSAIFNKDLITVHPLGGCVMADDAGSGVVNHKGQAFRDSSGTAVYEGLYVCDGSTIPRSLGAGPLLTISALSERSCALLAKDRGWQIDYTLPSRPARTAAPGRMGLRFTESARGAGMELDLIVVSDDLEGLVENRAAAAKVAGKVLAPAVCADPLRVVEGSFNLAERLYRLQLAGGNGKSYYLHALRAGTAIETVMHEGSDETGSVIARGTLRLEPRDLRSQLGTLRVTHASGSAARLKATEAAGRALAGALYDHYGSVEGGRKKRPLRTNAPTLHSFETGGTQGLMVRYEGGSRGPVLLSAGTGFSSAIFSQDTIETNLIEFLFERSYDVWVLDSDPKDVEAAATAVKARTRAGAVSVLWDGWEAGEPATLNAATRDAVPEAWGRISILGEHAAFDVYPEMVNRLAGRK